MTSSTSLQVSSIDRHEWALNMAQRVHGLDAHTLDIIDSALEALEEEGSDTCSYNSSFYIQPCFGGHRVIKKMEMVDGALVMRIILVSFCIPEYETGYEYDEDGEIIVDEDGNFKEKDGWEDEDRMEELLNAYYDSLISRHDEVAQIWLQPDGTVATLAQHRGKTHYDDTEGFDFDSQLRPVPITAIDDLLYDDYHCYDTREDEYGIIDKRVLTDRIGTVQAERMLRLLNDHCAVVGFDGVHERLHDQMAECFRHWSLDRIYADYVMQGVKSAAARHFHTIKIATRNKYVPSDQQLWLQLLDLIGLCRGNLQDPRVYAPANLEAAYDEWTDRNERRLAKIEKDKELKRIEEAERRYFENKALHEQEDSEYHRDKRPFLAVRFDTETMEFHVLQDVREFFEEGLAQHHCVFNSKYYKMPDYIVMSCTDKKTGKRLSTVTIDVEKQSIVANLCKGNHVPRNEREIADTIVEHMPMFVQANKQRMAERNADYMVDENDRRRQESERHINAQFAGERQRERELMEYEERMAM